MSFSPRVPLMLPVLKINGKTDRTAIHFAVSGLWDQPHRMRLGAVNYLVGFLVGAKSCRNQWCHSLTQCQINSVTLYFTDLTEIMNKIRYSCRTVLKDVFYLHHP